jgi:hypothetical protein
LGVLKTSGSSTISIVCDYFFNIGSVEKIGVEEPSLAAIQTSSIS